MPGRSSLGRLPVHPAGRRSGSRFEHPSRGIGPRRSSAAALEASAYCPLGRRHCRVEGRANGGVPRGNDDLASGQYHHEATVVYRCATGTCDVLDPDAQSHNAERKLAELESCAAPHVVAERVIDVRTWRANSKRSFSGRGPANDPLRRLWDRPGERLSSIPRLLRAFSSGVLIVGCHSVTQPEND